jgi:ribosome-associated heat shock protein Hsp15
MAGTQSASSPVDAVRVDAWTWAVRLFPTRSAAAEACRGGHVKVNGSNAKPAHPVRKGDTVRALTPGGERIVVVAGVISRRVGAAVAAEQYEDRTPPAPPKEQGLAGLRDRGAGRPTKRDRRLTDRMRGRV